MASKSKSTVEQGGSPSDPVRDGPATISPASREQLNRREALRRPERGDCIRIEGHTAGGNAYNQARRARADAVRRI
jgi:hypothetical protein